uniref:Uncharacterized protein n=1 Tax=Rhodnius prolixus TaxID=13249 RepID=T1HKG2_RHOPR
MKRRAIRQQIPRTIADDAGTELTIAVCSTLTLSPNATLLDVDDSCIERLNRGVQHHKDSITSDFQHFSRGLRGILSEVKKIDEFLFDGPTRVVNYNKEIIESIREIDRIVKSTSISDLQLEYEEHQVSLLCFEYFGRDLKIFSFRSSLS